MVPNARRSDGDTAFDKITACTVNRRIIMLKTKTYTHIEGYELFSLCDPQYKYDVEGHFNDWFEPGQDCSIYFWIPTENELADEVDGKEWMQIIIDTLLANGFHYGDSMYIDISY